MKYVLKVIKSTLESLQMIHPWNQLVEKLIVFASFLSNAWLLRDRLLPRFHSYHKINFELPMNSHNWQNDESN